MPFGVVKGCGIGHFGGKVGIAEFERAAVDLGAAGGEALSVLNKRAHFFSDFGASLTSTSPATPVPNTWPDTFSLN